MLNGYVAAHEAEHKAQKQDHVSIYLILVLCVSCIL